MSAYPPEPWGLHGHAYVGVWLLRPHDARSLPPGTREVRLPGRVIVSAAFFVYEEPSPLTYRELMSTRLVREGWRPRVHITDIWVDSEASRDGGRALWAIPKEMSDFDVAPHSTYAADGIGSLQVLRRRMLPGRWPISFRVAQERDASAVVSPVAGRARTALVRARWTFARDGRLGALAGHRPLLTLALSPFHLVFGHR